MTQSRNHAEHNAVEAFIDRWRDTGGKERANYQLLLTELCQLLPLPFPDPRSHRNKLEDLRDEHIRQRLVDLSMIRTEASSSGTVYKC